jgi:O-antigen ligase
VDGTLHVLSGERQNVALGWTALVLVASMVGFAVTQASALLALPLTIICLLIPLPMRIITLTGLAFVLGLAPLPNFIPRGISLGDGYIFWVDIILILVAVFLTTSRSTRFSSSLMLFMGILGLLLVFGIVRGAELSDAFSDFRGPFRLLVVMFAVAWMIKNDVDQFTRVFTRLIAAITIWTAFVVALISILDVRIFPIRSGNAALYVRGGGTSVYEATRVTPDSGLLCVLTAAILLACYVLGVQAGLSRAYTTITIFAGAYVGVVSYTRSYLIVFAVIVVGSFLFSGHFVRTLLRSIVPVVGLAITAVLSYALATFVVPGLVDGVGRVYEAFSGRVLGGFGSETIANDSSATWRVRENGWAIESVKENFLFGTGFGVPYRDLQRGEIFSGNRGLLYIHNAYLWVLVKTGLVGVIVAAACIYVGVSRVGKVLIPSRRKLGTLISLAILSIALQMITSPTPFESGNAIVCGAIAGVIFGCVEIYSRTTAVGIHDRMKA